VPQVASLFEGDKEVAIPLILDLEMFSKRKPVHLYIKNLDLNVDI
jgi:hypothetical protein